MNSFSMSSGSSSFCASNSAFSLASIIAIFACRSSNQNNGTYIMPETYHALRIPLNNSESFVIEPIIGEFKQSYMHHNMNQATAHTCTLCLYRATSIWYTSSNQTPALTCIHHISSHWTKRRLRHRTKQRHTYACIIRQWNKQRHVAPNNGTYIQHSICCGNIKSVEI